MIGMIWAVAFDWADGLIARGMSGRNEMQGKFGAQLDVLIDIVSYGVTPAILIACYGGFEVEFLTVALFLLFASALRLSYFSVFGLSGGSHYTGLALDNNNIILVFIFIFEGWIGESFSMILLLLSLLIAVLNISQIKTPKLSSNPINVYLLGSYTVLITCFFYWKQSNQI
jgi:CDP-diacylglycerol---serine O-phosphatidyltransferase